MQFYTQLIVLLLQTPFTNSKLTYKQKSHKLLHTFGYFRGEYQFYCTTLARLYYGRKLYYYTSSFYKNKNEMNVCLEKQDYYDMLLFATYYIPYGKN